MISSKEYLINLREVFRKRMDEVDFCIGQEQVEKLFRELLEEPEPEQRVYNSDYRDMSAKDLSEVLENHFTKEAAIKLFERDDIFYTALKKKKG